MSEVKIFIQDSTLQSMHEELSERNAYLKRIVDAYANDDWDTIQANVKAGKGRAQYDIGTKFNTIYTATTGLTYDCPWVVQDNEYTAIDEDGKSHPGLLLQMDLATLEQIQFDAPENTIVDLTEEPNALEGWYYWGVTGTTYTKLTVSAGDALPTTYDSVQKCIFNDVNVLCYGYNRWSHSACEQWLNSDALAGNWWTAKHDGDMPPSQLNTYNGFMAGLESDFLKVIQPVKVQTACNTTTDAGAIDVTYDRFFLPSLEEIYAVPQLAGVEGNYWPYWKTITGLDEPSNAVNTARIKRNIMNASGSVVNQRLRSAYRGYSCDVWHVNTSGAVSNYYAATSYAALPACVIW